MPARAMIFELVKGPNFAVSEAQPPFSLDTVVQGYIELPGDEPGPDFLIFFGQTGSTASADLPVLDFRFAADGFEWTPATGRFSILGSLSGGTIDLLLLGLERDSCGSLAPCWFDIAGDSDGFGLDIYMPDNPDHLPGLVAGDLAFSVPLPAAGAEPLFAFRLAQAVPEPSTLLLLIPGFLAARLARFRPAARPPQP